IYINVKRIIKNNYILFDYSERKKLMFSHDVEIANEIYNLLSEELGFDFPEDEVYHLAIYIKGNRNHESTDIITEETKEIISEMLSYIKEQCNIDLSYDIELRISLALHFIPLNIRLSNNMQLKNPMLTDIKQNYTFAYELATLSGAFLRKKLGYVLNETELSYLAIYYNLSLYKQSVSSKPKRILILCSSRKSDSLLLKLTLKKWFNEMILEMDVLNLREVDARKLKKYDVIFTTIENDNIPLNAIKINYFLDEKDYVRIKNALQFCDEDKSLLDFFDENLFIRSLKSINIEEVIKEMCNLALKYKKVDSDLYESVILREKYGFTSFGNYIAIPHPNALISDETFVVTAILENPIKWGAQEVQLVFMICIKRECDKDLRRLFGALSQLLPNLNTIKSIIEERNFDFIIEKLNECL
ncbi:MAG: PTS sugar transporter subunit IIA, partial [Clostridium sp.]|uniref:BglG family transcription antiterminator n=1 Tax=Clostridium sp. TaxID=1506 RepID=UPI00290CD424